MGVKRSDKLLDEFPPNRFFWAYVAYFLGHGRHGNKFFFSTVSTASFVRASPRALECSRPLRLRPTFSWLPLSPGGWRKATEPAEVPSGACGFQPDMHQASSSARIRSASATSSFRPTALALAMAALHAAILGSCKNQNPA